MGCPWNWSNFTWQWVCFASEIPLTCFWHYASGSSSFVPRYWHSLCVWDQCLPNVGKEWAPWFDGCFVRIASPAWESVRGTSVPMRWWRTQSCSWCWAATKEFRQKYQKTVVLKETFSCALTRLFCRNWFAFLQFILLLHLWSRFISYL